MFNTAKRRRFCQKHQKNVQNGKVENLPKSSIRRFLKVAPFFTSVRHFYSWLYIFLGKLAVAGDGASFSSTWRSGCVAFRGTDRCALSNRRRVERGIDLGPQRRRRGFGLGEGGMHRRCVVQRQDGLPFG